jgi:hypothetical protein
MPPRKPIPMLNFSNESGLMECQIGPKLFLKLFYNIVVKLFAKLELHVNPKYLQAYEVLSLKIFFAILFAFDGIRLCLPSHSDLGSLCITIMSTTPTMPQVAHPKCHKTSNILETRQTRFVRLSLFSPLFVYSWGVHVDLCWNFIVGWSCALWVVIFVAYSFIFDNFCVVILNNEAIVLESFVHNFGMVVDTYFSKFSAIPKNN